MFPVLQVYQTMKITSLSNMIPFYDFHAVEKFSVDVVKYNFLQLNIDHSKGIVQFGIQVKKFNFIAFIILLISQAFTMHVTAMVTCFSQLLVLRL